MRKEFKPGQKVRLDVDFNNSSIVTVVNQTPNKLFTTVSCEIENEQVPREWEVMTYRLSELEKGIIIKNKNLKT